MSRVRNVGIMKLFGFSDKPEAVTSLKQEFLRVQNVNIDGELIRNLNAVFISVLIRIFVTRYYYCNIF